MEDARNSIKVGSVTFAVRETSIDGFDLKEGDVIGIGEKLIMAKGDNAETVAEELIDKLIDDDVSTVTLYYGHNTTDKEAEKLVEKLADKYESCDIDAHFGGQALYYYIIAME